MTKAIAGAFAACILATGCGAGKMDRTEVTGPAPPPEPERQEAPAPSVEPPEGAAAAGEQPLEGEAATGEQAAPSVEPALPQPAAREYPAAIRIGARVAVVRTEPEVVRVLVGDSLAMGDSVKMVAFDEGGDRVAGLRILPRMDSRYAAIEEGYLKGVAEGVAELSMAIRVPPPSGTGPPEIRTFSASVEVVGLPAESIDISAPPERLFTGSVIRLERIVRTADGTVRRRVDVEWTSNRRRLATVDQRGFVTALRPGEVLITARAEGVEQTLNLTVEENPAASVELAGPSRARTGDVIRLSATALDADGQEVEGAPVAFSVAAADPRGGAAATVYADGAFVAERPGLYRIAGATGAAAGQHLVEVTERGGKHEATVIGRGSVADRPTSDLWAFTGIDGRDYVYTGTHSGGQRMLAWDVTNPANPVLTDFVEVDARVVNDVKVNESATVAVITREGASDRKNGIVLLDLTDPAHPVIASRYTKDLTGGVHNVFFNGDVLYAVHNGTLDVHVLDVSDPTDVEEIGRWGIDVSGKYLHDVWVADGLAYVSYWDDGVYVLDVGDGRWGGAPAAPVEVSSFAYGEGNTHVAFPYTNADGHRYLFVGDEIFGCDECVSRNGHPGDGSRGFVHVLDMEDPENPREVARYEVPEAGAHNLWVEDDKMYVAYYQGGLRVVDVSGELRGDLYRQGREIAWLPTGSPDGFVPNSPMAWGPQPFKGHVFVSDLNSGLWVVRVAPKDGEAKVS